MKTCLCGAPMRVVSDSRGYITYACAAGCEYYLYEETGAGARTEESECVANV